MTKISQIWVFEIASFFIENEKHAFQAFSFSIDSRMRNYIIIFFAKIKTALFMHFFREKKLSALFSFFIWFSQNLHRMYPLTPRSQIYKQKFPKIKTALFYALFKSKKIKCTFAVFAHIFTKLTPNVPLDPPISNI